MISEVFEMARYVTRVSVWFNSEGASPSTVIRKLVSLGFIPVRGAYDFIYKHESPQDMTESELSTAIIEISNALHKTLAGFKVLYTLDTHTLDDESDYVPLEDIDAELEATRKEIQELERETSEFS
ncbi:MAG: hypothetical protein C4K47_05910 [Candidatus Thorarchaeota archaeon]|nr:MAG: hypothetical protein C4K47_05910 [Candidatus Thorarchaeota archaeon]